MPAETFRGPALSFPGNLSHQRKNFPDPSPQEFPISSLETVRAMTGHADAKGFDGTGHGLIPNGSVKNARKVFFEYLFFRSNRTYPVKFRYVLDLTHIFEFFYLSCTIS